MVLPRTYDLQVERAVQGEGQGEESERVKAHAAVAADLASHN